MKKINIITNNHLKTKRNYIQRMVNNKVKCMSVAKKYGKDYWDGKRKYGYGGYKYINGYLAPVAKKLIKIFKLSNNSKIIDIGCGKGFLLYEIKKILPNIKIVGLDISRYAKKNAKKEIKKQIRICNVKNKLPFSYKSFDLAISINCFHNLKIHHLEFALNEIIRISNQQYISVESYRNNLELFNLQCWALTCESFFSKSEWEWLFKKNKFKGFYEFIYFN
tara:strand:+ start:134 stop:796 length:663 start_codon:yes stop_codon:yes gene_type:complete